MFGERLQQLRSQRDMKQAVLAKRLIPILKNLVTVQ